MAATSCQARHEAYPARAMTPAEFTIRVVPERHLVCIIMAGFFDVADIDRFAAARDEAHRALTSGPGEHLTMVDIRGMQIQSQDSVAAFSRLLTDPRQRSRRIAFVVAKSLARMQIQRAAQDRDDAGYFTDPDEAERWLLGE